MTSSVPHPCERVDQFGRNDVERDIRSLLDRGQLSHGWIISGGRGAGKATFAYRIARAVLSPDNLTTENDLEIKPDCKAARLVAARAHPDLFVAERDWDEKKSRFKSEISVATIRRLITFLNHTSSSGGARVAIIDTADDLNRNAANALLKALEEPPRHALLLVLSESPGRLLATIRSRCRQITLPPLSRDSIDQLLEKETELTPDERRAIAALANGRPGYALTLAHDDGLEAAQFAQRFLTATIEGDFSADLSAGFSLLNDDQNWTNFQDALCAALHEKATHAIATDDHQRPGLFADAFRQSNSLLRGGDALNMNRAQIIDALSYDLRAIFHSN